MVVPSPAIGWRDDRRAVDRDELLKSDSDQCSLPA
jgi:hypothetical protein